MKQFDGRLAAYFVFSVLMFLLGPGCLDSRLSSNSDVEIWVVDQEGGTIRAFDPTTHAWLGDVVELDAGVAPSSVALHGDRVMVTDFASGELLSIDLQPGAPAEVTFRNGPPGSTPRLEEPCAVEIVDGSAWVLGNDSRNLLSFGDGQITELVALAEVIFCLGSRMILQNAQLLDVRQWLVKLNRLPGGKNHSLLLQTNWL